MSKARLLILSFSNIASDARVLKQVRLFVDRYEVTTCGYGPSPDPRVHHRQLDDENGFSTWTRHDLALRRFTTIYWNLPAVVQAQNLLASSDPFDAVIANDIDTVGLALSLQAAHRVHADIHEFAPRQNEELLMWRLFNAPYVRWMCRSFLPQVASMTTVGQGLADEYLRVFGLTAEIVTNATPHADLNPQPVGTPIKLVHSGASLRNRRLETLVDAVKATRTDVTLDLYLMGNDPDYIVELGDRAAGSPRVRIREPLPYEHLIAKLNEYDIGVHVIAPTNFNNSWSLPNKFFDYVQARLGLIIGPSPEMRHLLEEHDLGAVTEDFSADALTQVLDALTPERVSQWKASAHDAARALSAEAQVAVWDKAVASLLESPARG